MLTSPSHLHWGCLIVIEGVKKNHLKWQRCREISIYFILRHECAQAIFFISKGGFCNGHAYNLKYWLTRVKILATIFIFLRVPLFSSTNMFFLDKYTLVRTPIFMLLVDSSKYAIIQCKTMKFSSDNFLSLKLWRRIPNKAAEHCNWRTRWNELMDTFIIIAKVTVSTFVQLFFLC